MRIDVQTPRTSYGILAAIGVALALALCVLAGRAFEAPAAQRSARRPTTDHRRSLRRPGAGDGERRTRVRPRGRAHRGVPRGAQVGPSSATSRTETTRGRHFRRRPRATGVHGLALAGRRVDAGAVPASHLRHQHHRAPDGEGADLGSAACSGNGSPRPNVGEAALWSPWLGTGSNAFQQVTPPVIDVDGPGGQPPVPAPFWCSGLSQLAERRGAGRGRQPDLRQHLP